MTLELARHLLDRMGVLRHPCDLDLLVFFVRYPHVLMASERVAAFLGYDLKQVSDSLDMLLTKGLLTRTANPVHGARMYVFAVGEPNGWLPEFLEQVSTQHGRQLLRRAMKRGGPSPLTGSGA